MAYETVPAAPGGGGGEGGVTDHGELTGLADNDHPQYAALASAGLLTHGATTGNGKQLVLTGAGVSAADDSTPNVRTYTISGGAGATLADAAPPAIAAAGAVGVATDVAREDHTHAHGNQAAGGSLHAAVTTSVNGFMIAADKTKLDSLPAAKYTASQTLGSAQTSITFSGLDGNTHKGYRITGHGQLAADGYINIQLNGAAVDFSNGAYHLHSAAAIAGQTGNLVFGCWTAAGNGTMFVIEVFANAIARRGGFARITSYHSSGGGNTYYTTFVINDTTTNLTSIALVGQTGQFATGFKVTIEEMTV